MEKVLDKIKKLLRLAERSDSVGQRDAAPIKRLEQAAGGLS